MIKLSRVFLGIGVIVVFGISSSLAYQVLTNHNNAARTGRVSSETQLTPANVFGLKILFQKAVDGQVYAQPLCVTNQLVYKNGVSAGRHSIIIVATEHGSVYAFDAKDGTLYWQVSLLDQGCSPVQASDPNLNGCGDLVPEIGITATPVIDPSAGPHGRVFVIMMETDGRETTTINSTRWIWPRVRTR